MGSVSLPLLLLIQPIAVVLQDSFICLSIYVHMGFFLIVLVIVELLSSHWIFWPKFLGVFQCRKFNTILSLLLALFLTGAGFAVTRSAPVVNRVNVKIRDLPPSLDGFTIVLLTDIHIGPTVNRKRIEEIVAKTNALHADMIAISGDLVDGFLSNLVQPTLPLAKLKSKYGVYYTTGNHEYYYGDIDEWLHYFATKFNITVLRNENRNLCSSSGDCICIAGTDDLFTEKLRIPDHHMDGERALSGCSEKQPVVLLAHQPNGASKILRNTKKRIDLILSGHTHAGQFYIVWLLAYLKNDFLYGLYKIKNRDTQIYVSSGVNYWGPPVKMFNLCEITLLTLHYNRRRESFVLILENCWFQDMNLRIIRFPVIVASIISVTSIVFLDIFGSAIFGVNDVHDYRKGNRERQLSTVRFEFFTLPFSVFLYFRLIELAKYVLAYNSNGIITDRAAKHLQMITIGTILWLLLGHATLFLYFIPNLPRFFVTLSFLSIGLWYHVVIPLVIFAILTAAVTICHPFISKCLSKCSVLEAFCLNKNVQTTFTLIVAVFLSFFSYIFCDTNVSINVKDLPDSAKDIRFALISDIHAGATVFKEQVVDRVNSQEVDGVFIVGDVVDAPRNSIEDRVRPLQFLKPKTFYVSGNHEYYYGNASEWFDLFQQYGFKVLNNRHVLFRGICVAGVSDYSSGRSGLPDHLFQPVEALKGCPENTTTIVLSHNPASAEEIAFNNAHLRVDLILSGHTHAGQFYTVAPIVYWMLPYYYGLYQISLETQLFVTAGTFYQGAPMKMVWTSEIWIIKLHVAS
uniref:Metallophos domain-containing protein n=1 Tax=Elaeophora elaphi TaxID=1147741 RepID=A0A158Q8Q3_9BILA